MPDSTERPAAGAAIPSTEPRSSSKPDVAPSPARSDKSSDSEGRPVREKLKDTRIDAQASADPAPTSHLSMNDTANGTRSRRGDASSSSSDTERGRLRRKRSREDFEDDQDEKHPEKKQERHSRKKSRDVTSPVSPDLESLAKSTKSSVSRIDEHDADVSMSSTSETVKHRQATPEVAASGNHGDKIKSPQNKRTRDQIESEAKAAADQVKEPSTDSDAAKTDGERGSKRPRDRNDGPSATETTENQAKIPPGSGFANASAASPFTALSPKTLTAKAPEKPIEDLPKTSDDKFKTSGFSSFSSTNASPFGNIGNTSSSSPFTAAAGKKLTSFASGADKSTSTSSGFMSLGKSTGKSPFGGSALGLAGSKPGLGGTPGIGTFGGLGGAKNTFATPGQQGISGLTQKTEKPFGAPPEPGEEDETEEGSGDGDGDGTSADDQDQSRPSAVLPQEPPATGEEGEKALWSGRAKLYTIGGEGANRAWQERGSGTFKLNVTEAEPTRARFVLRADGTHRLLLNAAVTRQLTFGDAQGVRPKEGRLLFNSPTADGELEMHLLRMKPENAQSLWDTVDEVKQAL